MKSEIQINNSAEVCRIDIEGTIGIPEEWQFDDPEARVATYERFSKALQRIAGIEAPEVVVNIRSTGGDVNDALLIHDAPAATAGTHHHPLLRLHGLGRDERSRKLGLGKGAAKSRRTPSI